MSIQATNSRAVSPTCVTKGAAVDISFSHVHIYADSVDNLDTYKQLETQCNELSSKCIQSKNKNDSSSRLDLAKCRKMWKSIITNSSSNIGNATIDTSYDINNEKQEEEFVTQNRDVVKQLIAGFGFRVTATRMAGDEGVHSNTRTALVTSADPCGVQILITSIDESQDSEAVTEDECSHFDASNLRRFFQAHSNRQGIAVLAFEVNSGSIQSIFDKYHELHPKLLTEAGMKTYADGTKVMEVYAYYKGDVRVSEADDGTVLRFVQKEVVSPTNTTGGTSLACILPGLKPVDAQFDSSSQAAYCDHWVSNVVSRKGFLDTLEDTLGFTPKVDFNAGVVAAGEAQIESTVTGNDSVLMTNQPDIALKDQSQVYLPINNALSEVGHVHGFLEELGQGIQHVASKVKDLPSFVQRANENRKIIGEGFTFLKIPRSYYGVLSERHLVSGFSNIRDSEQTILSPLCAEAIFAICEHNQIITPDGAVDLDITSEAIAEILDANVPSKHREEYHRNKTEVIKIILFSRYANLYSLLRHHLTEESYLKIVRNQILVDVQGEDLLLQIFTCNILQRQIGEEAPFFEFIQRVCSECTDSEGCPVSAIKPGCGGFGIRNFLTLFLSIEVSKAMLEVSRAKAAGDIRGEEFAQRMVDTFTDQLNESNPILTEIADAMTAEGKLKTQLEEAVLQEDGDSSLCTLREKLGAAGEAKALGNKKLMDCSMKYRNKMRVLRESRRL